MVTSIQYFLVVASSPE